jgi:hypothetical protein
MIMTIIIMAITITITVTIITAPRNSFVTVPPRYEKAVHAFRQAISVDRSNADALLSLADTLHRRMGQRFSLSQQVVELS